VGANDVVIDVACGTGDLTLKFFGEVWRQRVRPLKHIPGEYMKPTTFASPGQVVGIDFTFEMLAHARQKRLSWGGPAEFLAAAAEAVQRHVLFVNGDAQSLPLPDASADVLSIAFGIRNVADPAAAIREFHRVLRPGGRLVILEFSLPTNPLLRTLYNLYFRKILPRTATWISRDKTGAYKYLPESVNTFITRQRMTEMMQSAGFSQVQQHPMTFGVCVCYRGVKN
jgi:demethylmenaquinone methyltransferase/2-methoxy-6-polyprenyl-1,4-benzoquinol methylase